MLGSLRGEADPRAARPLDRLRSPGSLVGDYATLGERAEQLAVVATEQSFPTGVQRERSFAVGSWSELAMWQRGYRSFAVVRWLTEPPGPRCGCPNISLCWPRHVRSQGKLKRQRPC